MTLPGRKPPDFVPSKPDRSRFKHNVDERTKQYEALLMPVGYLMAHWSNNEALLAYYLQNLVGTDSETALTILYSVGTARGRFDLLNNLVELNVPHKKVREKVRSLFKRFASTTKTRNKFAHALYEVDQQGFFSHITSVNLAGFSGDNLLARQPVDRQAVNEILDAAKRLAKLNQDLWDYLPVFAKYMKEQRSKQHKEDQAGG